MDICEGAGQASKEAVFVLGPLAPAFAAFPAPTAMGGVVIKMPSVAI